MTSAIPAHVYEIRPRKGRDVGAIYDVRYGTFEAPDDFAFKHTGTIDSFMGTLTRKSDGFTISFDIGYMAGVQCPSSW